MSACGFVGNYAMVQDSLAMIIRVVRGARENGTSGSP